MNFLPCSYDSNQGCLAGRGFTYVVPARFRPALDSAPAQPLVLGIRPEDIMVSVEPGGGDGVWARVYMSEPLGRENLLTLEIGGVMLRALSAPEIQVRLDQSVALTFPPNRVYIFDKASEKSLS
jgi:ABC-type sugar transport system ATPase subunit